MVPIAYSDFQHSTTLRECGHRPSATYRRLRQVGLNAFRGVPPGGCYLQTLSDGWNMLEPSAGGMSKPTVLKCTKEKEKIEKSRTTIFTKRYQSKLHFQFMAGFCHGFQLFPMVFPWIPRNGMVPSPSQVPTAHGSRPATCGRPG